VTEASSQAESPRFIADVMLGSLARWLRVLGFDTLYDNRIDDEELVRLALRDRRIALTRDRRLTERRAISNQAILIRSDALREQLQQVLERIHFRLDPARAGVLLLSRCIECNSPLSPIERASVEGQVPSYVFSTQVEFKKCGSCGRIYWGGTHRDRMLEKLARLLEG